MPTAPPMPSARCFPGQPDHGKADEGPAGGWLGAWAAGDHWTQIALLPTELKGFLARQGFDSEAILHTWSDRGWIRAHGRHRTRQVVVAGRRLRCIVVHRAACDAVSGEDGASDSGEGPDA